MEANISKASPLYTVCSQIAWVGAKDKLLLGEDISPSYLLTTTYGILSTKLQKEY